MWIVRIAGMGAILSLGLGATPAAGYGMQAIENNWTLCDRHTQKREHEQRIPHRLLRAISLAESGRWHPDTGEISAWPWTVMAQGKGRFFDSKQAALAWVRKLQNKGITNIDVGCMQINLFHHGHQFPSLEHAFDPEHNTRYAAKFLKEKYTAARSWTMAAGHYHSTNAEKNTPYRRKVFQFWHGQSQHESQQQKPTRRLTHIAQQQRKTQVSRLAQKKQARLVAINHYQMRKLNARFREAKRDVIIQPAALQPSFSQRPNGKNNQSNTLPSKRLLKQSLKKIAHLKSSKKEKAFSKRRRAQIQQWRRGGAWQIRRNDG